MQNSVPLKKRCTAMYGTRKRLRQLGFIEDKPFSEFVDPLEVMKDEGQSEETIAASEGLTQQAISKSILGAIKKLKKYLKNGL